MAGCGDHGCIVEKPNGMGTNGGCRCLKELPSDKRIEVKRKINRLEAENARLEREKAELVEALGQLNMIFEFDKTPAPCININGCHDYIKEVWEKTNAALAKHRGE